MHDHSPSLAPTLDVDEHDAKALEAAVRWAQTRTLPPVKFGLLITGVGTDLAAYGRLFTLYERREPVWRETAYKGRQQIRAPELELSSVRPWEQTEQDIDRRSRHIAICSTCDGRKTVACSLCGGSARVSCSGCLGTGANFGRGKKLLVNCRRCRGSGTQKCGGCVGGQVDCPRCDRCGRLERWIEITFTTRNTITAMPNEHLCSRHPGFMEPSPMIPPWSASTQIGSAEAHGRIPEDEVAALLPDIDWLSMKRSVESALNPAWDRVIRQTFQIFSAPASKVSFEFSGKNGHVLLIGNEPEPTSDFDDTPFRNRRNWIVFAATLGLLASLAAFAVYASRAQFYSGLPSWLLLASLLTMTAGLSLRVAAWRRRRGCENRTNPRLPSDRIGSGVAATGLLGATLIALLVRPSATTALEHIEVGDFSTAEEHLKVLAESGDNSIESQAAETQLALARARTLDNREAVRLITQAIPRVIQQDELLAELERLRVDWIKIAIDAGRLDEADIELRILHDEAPTSPLIAQLSAAVTERRYRGIQEHLTNGAPDKALTLLENAPRNDPRSLPMRLTAYQLKAEACGASDLMCIVKALAPAATLEPEGPAAKRIAELRAAELTKARALPIPAAPPEARINALDAALKRYSELAATFGDSDEFSSESSKIRAMIDALLLSESVLGSTPTLATRVLDRADFTVRSLGSSLVAEGLPGVDGVVVHLPIQVGKREQQVVTGAHIAQLDHASRSLELTTINRVLKLLTGSELSNRALKAPGKGISHLTVTLGRHRAVLGWHGTHLVEVIVGKVDP